MSSTESYVANPIPVVHTNVTNSTDHTSLQTTEQDTISIVLQNLFWYVPPVMFAIGIPGNLLSIMLVCRPAFTRSSMKPFIIALAVTDTSLLVLGLGRYWVKNVFQFDIRLTHMVACCTHTFLVYWLVHVCSWLVVGMTWQRTLVVVFPYNMVIKQCMRSRFPKLYIATVPLTLSFLNSYFFWTHRIRDYHGSYRCVSKDGFQTFNHIWRWVDLALASIIPFTLIMMGNISIISKVIMASSQRRTLSAASRKGNSAQQQHESGMTVLLLMVSFIFLICTLPLSMYFVFFRYFMSGHAPTPTMRLLVTMATFLSYVNNCINFYLYIISGKKFRAELMTMFKDWCRCCQSNKRETTYIAITEQTMGLNTAVN